MKIAASIVTFNPEFDRLTQNIEALICQVDNIIIIDNASENIEAIRKLLGDYNKEKIILREYPNNYGLAYALNEAFNIAFQGEFEWLVTMDQDSSLSEGYVDTCRRLIKEIKDNRIGIICSDVRDLNGYKNDTPIRSYSNNEVSCFREIACITSGAFTNVKAGIECGGFDNSMFIDQIDYDLCFKLRSCGYSIYRSNDIYINHELGRIEQKNLLGVRYLTTNHSAMRLYYIYRNYFVIKKNHWNLARRDRDVKKWFKQQGLRLAYRPLKIIIAERDKLNKIRSIIRGVVAGMKIYLKK